jgi:hypothetical protein
MVQSMRLEEAIARIETQLRQQQTHFTLTEAAAMTGLAIDDAREALDALLTRYVCRLQVSEYGDLIYNFGETLRRRDAKTFAERMQEVGAWLWKIFTVIYKVWITVTLVVYFVIFLVLLILVVIAASMRQSSDDNRRRNASINLAPLWQMFYAIFRWRTITGAIDYAQDRQGYRYRHYQPEPSVLNTQKKSFIAAVYDFVFGPPRVALDPLQNEKEVAAFLHRNKGILVASELSALAGWTFAQAETFLTDCVLRYQGDTRVSENAVLYGQFDMITRGVGEVEEGEIVYYWDEYEPEYELTGNSAMHNLIIVGMNSFNVLLSLLVLSGSFNALLQEAFTQQFATTTASVASGPFVTLVLGWIPLVFSVLFFLIPLVRAVRIQALRRQRHAENIRKRLFHALFARQGEPQTVAEVVAAVDAATQEEALAPPVVEEAMQALVLDMPGDMLVSESAEVQFAFPRITRELHEVKQLRRQRRVDDTLGEIIVESDNQ